MNKLIFALFLLLFAPPGPAVVAAQANVETAILTFPVERREFIPCANGGAGEFVVLTGETRVLLHSTGNPNNNLTLRHAQTHLTGVGEITGDVYRASGMATDTHRSGPGLSTLDLIMNSLRIIGQGPGNDFTLHQTLHILFTPSEKAITSGHFRVECK